MTRSVYPPPGSIRTKARGSIVLGASQITATATIGSVNMANARLNVTGWTSSSGAAPIGTDIPAISLTSSTQITAARSTGSTVVVTVNYELEEVY